MAGAVGTVWSTITATAAEAGDVCRPSFAVAVKAVTTFS